MLLGALLSLRAFLSFLLLPTSVLVLARGWLFVHSLVSGPALAKRGLLLAQTVVDLLIVARRLALLGTISFLLSCHFFSFCFSMFSFRHGFFSPFLFSYGSSRSFC